MGFTLPEEKTRVPPNAQNENFTLSIMGFTIPEEKHLYLPMQEMKTLHY